MIAGESNKQLQCVCNLNYLTEMMNGNKNLIKGVMDTFLIQIPEELEYINTAIIKLNYAKVKGLAHSMKSSVGIMGITVLEPILQEMEDLSLSVIDTDRIKVLNEKLNLICRQAIEEIGKINQDYH